MESLEGGQKLVSLLTRSVIEWAITKSILKLEQFIFAMAFEMCHGLLLPFKGPALTLVTEEL